MTIKDNFKSYVTSNNCFFILLILGGDITPSFTTATIAMLHNIDRQTK